MLLWIILFTMWFMPVC